MKKKRRPTVQEIGFADFGDGLEEPQHLLHLRQSIRLAAALINDMEVAKVAQRIAITGKLRRLGYIERPNEIELLVIPKARKKITGEPEFETDPNVPFYTNYVIEKLQSWEGRGRNAIRQRWNQIDKITFRKEDPFTAIIHFNPLNQGQGTVSIILVPSKRHWGINRIATSGDVQFNAWAKSRQPNGMLPEGVEYAIDSQMLMDTKGKKPREISADTETKVFNLCGMRYIPTGYRVDNLWKTYLESGANLGDENDDEEESVPRALDLAYELMSK